MTMAVLFGAGSGALHAVTGPDHVLSLGPVALAERDGSWRIGLKWGAGHALGTLLLAVPVLVLASSLHAPLLAAWGERMAGLALIATALWSWYHFRNGAKSAPAANSRSPLLVGLIHGLSGAGSLLLVLPVVVSSSLPRGLSYLGAFAIGGTMAMAGLTWAISRLGGVLSPRTLNRVQPLLSLASVTLGLTWLLAP